MNDKQVGNKHKGCIGEHYAMYDACKKGYLVGKITESDLLGYDFVMDDGEKLYRVEVKTSDKSRKSEPTGITFDDRVVFDLTTKSNCGNTNRYNHVHWFALFCPRFNKIAWIKKENVDSKKTLYRTDFEHLQLPVNDKLKDLTIVNEEDDNDNQECLF